jgi:peptide-methionine (S)-S-oxide reductase
MMQTETIVFGGGCFWCTEAVFKMLKGVLSVEPGYTGSPKVEVVKIEYDPEAIAFEELLQVFFGSHDPTQLNRQGPDVGPEYRSAVFYTKERQREKAQHYIDVLNKGAAKPIVTEVTPLEKSYPAEDYHKNFYESGQRPDYCQLVIDPKIEKVQSKFKNLLK